MSVIAPDAIESYEEPRENYLNVRHDIRSWIFTLDHKRIAILYLLSISVFFLLGAIGAALDP